MLIKETGEGGRCWVVLSNFAPTVLGGELLWALCQCRNDNCSFLTTKPSQTQVEKQVYRSAPKHTAAKQEPQILRFDL